MSAPSSRYVFTGKVFPERACVTVEMPPLTVPLPGTLEMSARIAIQLSQITAVIDSHYVFTNLYTLRNIVESLCRIPLDAYGFTTGRGYDLEITSCLTPESELTVFGVGLEELQPVSTSIEHAAGLCASDLSMRQAVSDIREAIRSPLDSPFFAYRAVEAVMHGFADGRGKQQAWTALRHHLRVDEAVTRELENSAKSVRHGDMSGLAESPLSSRDRLRGIALARSIIDRYARYRLEGAVDEVTLELPPIMEAAARWDY